MTDQFEDPAAGRTAPMWPRVVGTIVYLVLAAPLLAAVSDAPPEQRFLLGLMQALLWLLIIGSLNWVIARMRGKRRPWWHATFSTGPLLIAFVLALATSTGQREADALVPRQASASALAIGDHARLTRDSRDRPAKREDAAD